METSTIYQLLKKVLYKKFDEQLKHEIKETDSYFNFSCPICGDSTKDYSKHRGYLYFKNLRFKCYNCNASTTLYNLLSQYLQLSNDELENILELQEKYKDVVIDDSTLISQIISESKNFEHLPTISNFINTKRIIPIQNTFGEEYLLSRFQEIKPNFFYHKYFNQLYILNTVQDKLLGYQIRNLNKDATTRYLTFKTSKIYQDHPHLFTSDDIKHFDKISNVFGVGSINVDDIITVFEGPLDANLYRNSVGVCSVQNDFSFSGIKKQYFFDFDMAGLTKMIKLIQQGFPVFLWTKFLYEHGLSKEKKWDLNDLISFSKINNIQFKDFSNYFSKDTLDLIWI
jgi:predicted RNA-binding Zn-ribbon protein involved in translation (DUF1610 family)